MRTDPLFPGFFIGGFECSTHRLACGRRLDMVAATGHDRLVEADYRRLLAHGIRTAREGIRWHLIEPTPGRFDFRSALMILRAAREAGIQVIWDLLHYGWPDDLDIWGPEFVDRFARLARGFAGVLADEWPGVAWFAPVNEVSYLSWMGGQVARINPFARGRGDELKDRLVRATIAATREIREVLPSARFAQVEPIFHVIPHPDRPEEAGAAESYRLAQYEVWDKLSGRLSPELGGSPEYLDVIGVNYYPWNQWIFEGEEAEGTGIGPDHPGYRPFREMLLEHFGRYGRPLFVAETGTEGDARAGWLAHVGEEVRTAIRDGADIHGLCLYPIVSFPGWDNGRDCRNGLWEQPDEHGHRPIHEPLATELVRQMRLLRPHAPHAQGAATGA
ncbi:beta-glucosidase [Tundrisphaera sp. TA3]|uniref:beta-glucosidase n=1 Tax=Tundrisphaera sp. TA3 TaxID=3435775 RepID=UPI003EC1507E